MKLNSRTELTGSYSPEGGGFIIKHVPDGSAVNECVVFGIHAPEELLISAPVRVVPACLLRPVGDSGNSGLEVFPKQDVLPDAITRLSAGTGPRSGSSTPACLRRG